MRRKSGSRRKPEPRKSQSKKPSKKTTKKAPAKKTGKPMAGAMMTTRELAEELGISISRVKQIAKTANIVPVVDLPRMKLWATCDVDKFKERNTKRGPKPYVWPR